MTRGVAADIASPPAKLNAAQYLPLQTGSHEREQLQALAKHLDHWANRVPMELGKAWHLEGHVPRSAGWYFIETDTPVDVLKRQHRPQAVYKKKKSGDEAPVKIYDIAGSANRYADDLKDCWNTAQVYSGLAKNLQSRSREHTSPDLGTAALALSLYPELRQYQWTFCYVEMTAFLPGASCPEMLLRLGEQIWRATNGWPLLSRA